jgi:hypothetical protein
LEDTETTAAVSTNFIPVRNHGQFPSSFIITNELISPKRIASTMIAFMFILPTGGITGSAAGGGAS